MMSFSSSLHVGHMAEYEYELLDNVLTLEFRIEQAELMNFEFGINCDFKNSMGFCATQYLNNNTILQIDGDTVEFVLIETYKVDDYRIVHFEADLDVESIGEINIENKCFLMFDQDFKNRVIIDIGGFQKSYLLDSKKSSIHLN